ncbi:leukocyte elastase inhibitor-like isoform X2 [Lampris incognitus]|uniref:leukocyte elastase inhibitor-like isoform X2 n=1 Tax=Lampris incognitus TaxID=2546036 RepID=UPI0024B62496|nr:leukocyte elastase inhibitor-like isoform X2 [Lampris incognitus]
MRKRKSRACLCVSFREGSALNASSVASKGRVTCRPETSAYTMASSTPLSEANTTFSLDLLKKLTEEKKTGNVFYSPLSISSALAMVMLGARGNTATQMSESLQLQKAEGDVHVGFAKLMSELNRPGTPYSLSLANRLYGEQSYQFVEEFLGETRKHYNAELVPVDFRTNSERARVDINTWVEKQTQDKIKNLLKKGIVDEMTRLVLVNAIYFKGNWDKQFKADLTSDSTFRLNKNETKTVKMMYQKGKFPLTFIPEVNCQILEMPYTGKDLSMVIILPNDMEDNTTGLEKIESKLTYESFVDWTRPDMMDKIEVKVGLPRFKMEETYDMNAILTSMGMRDAFDQRCSDFSGMSTANDLVLSTVVHKAFVEVNEEGTEAAAATAAVMMTRSSRMPAAFIADHPFLFFIRHNSSSSILFAGRYCSPA